VRTRARVGGVGSAGAGEDNPLRKLADVGDDDDDDDCNIHLEVGQSVDD